MDSHETQPPRPLGPQELSQPQPPQLQEPLQQSVEVIASNSTGAITVYGSSGQPIEVKDLETKPECNDNSYTQADRLALEFSTNLLTNVNVLLPDDDPQLEACGSPGNGESSDNGCIANSEQMVHKQSMVTAGTEDQQLSVKQHQSLRLNAEEESASTNKSNADRRRSRQPRSEESLAKHRAYMQEKRSDPVFRQEELQRKHKRQAERKELLKQQELLLQQEQQQEQQQPQEQNEQIITATRESGDQYQLQEPQHGCIANSEQMVQKQSMVTAGYEDQQLRMDSQEPQTPRLLGPLELSQPQPPQLQEPLQQSVDVIASNCNGVITVYGSSGQPMEVKDLETKPECNSNIFTKADRLALEFYTNLLTLVDVLLPDDGSPLEASGCSGNRERSDNGCIANSEQMVQKQSMVTAGTEDQQLSVKQHQSQRLNAKEGSASTNKSNADRRRSSKPRSEESLAKHRAYMQEKRSDPVFRQEELQRKYKRQAERKELLKQQQLLLQQEQQQPQEQIEQIITATHESCVQSQMQEPQHDDFLSGDAPAVDTSAVNRGCN